MLEGRIYIGENYEYCSVLNSSAFIFVTTDIFYFDLWNTLLGHSCNFSISSKDEFTFIQKKHKRNASLK